MCSSLSRDRPVHLSFGPSYGLHTQWLEKQQQLHLSRIGIQQTISVSLSERSASIRSQVKASRAWSMVQNMRFMCHQLPCPFLLSNPPFLSGLSVLLVLSLSSISISLPVCLAFVRFLSLSKEGRLSCPLGSVLNPLSPCLRFSYLSSIIGPPSTFILRPFHPPLYMSLLKGHYRCLDIPPSHFHLSWTMATTLTHTQTRTA